MKLKNKKYYWVKSKHNGNIEIVQYFNEDAEGVLHIGHKFFMHIDNYEFLKEVEDFE
jgi:hypothetical protein